MRPKKIRWIKCNPGKRCFMPYGISRSGIKIIDLTVDEFEAVRLACYEEMKQEDASKLMKISRPTFSRILTSALKKIAYALVNINAIRIKGGCCSYIKKNKTGGIKCKKKKSKRQ
jgi:predicted DNA-binding protein (UPF0251 family)